MRHHSLIACSAALRVGKEKNSHTSPSSFSPIGNGTALGAHLAAPFGRMTQRARRRKRSFQRGSFQRITHSRVNAEDHYKMAFLSDHVDHHPCTGRIPNVAEKRQHPPAAVPSTASFGTFRIDFATLSNLGMEQSVPIFLVRVEDGQDRQCLHHSPAGFSSSVTPINLQQSVQLPHPRLGTGAPSSYSTLRLGPPITLSPFQAFDKPRSPHAPAKYSTQTAKPPASWKTDGFALTERAATHGRL